MLKIKTLKPKSNKKLIKYIHDNGVTECDVASCLGMSSTWFITCLNHKKFNKQDTKTVKDLVKKLAGGNK